MRERRLLLLFLLVVALGSAAEANFFSDAFNSLKNTFGNWGDIIKEKFQNLSESWSEKFDDLSDKLKSMLDKNDFSDATFEELLKDIPEGGWKELQPRMMMSMKMEEAQKLIDDTGDKVPQRFKDEIKRLMIANQTDDKVLDQARDDLLKCADLLKSGGETKPSDCKMNLVEAETLMARFGTQDKWSKKNITDLDLVALSLPVCMDRVTNAEARQALLDTIAKCAVSSRPQLCPSVTEVGEMEDLIQLQQYGPVGDLTKEKLQEWGGVQLIPREVINFLPTSMVKEFKDDIKNKVNVDSATCTLSEDYIRRICEVEPCAELTKDTSKDWYNKMGLLKVCVTPSYISEDAMENEEVATGVTGQTTNQKQNMRPSDARRIMKNKLKDLDKDATTVDKGNVNDIGGHVLARGPTCFLKGTGDRNLLASILGDASASIKGMKGAEYMSKTRTLTEACMKEALDTSTNRFTPGKVEENFKPFISSRLLRDQSPGILKQITDLADKNGHIMTERQIEAVHSKVNADTASDLDFPTFIRDYLSSTAIKDSSVNVLTKLSKDMDPLSLPCLKGAEQVWGDGKDSISSTDIAAYSDFLQCMTANQANKVKSKDIFEVFNVIKQNKGILSADACRIFGQKVEEWYREISEDEDADMQEVWTNMYVGELEKIPPCVFAEFGMLDLDLLGSSGQTVALRRLCGANNYNVITPQARRWLVNDLLERRIGDGMVTKCDLDLLDQCAFDINADLLKKMDEMAKVTYINKLQELMMMGSPGGKWMDMGCQDEATRSQVGVIIAQVKGEPSTWKTAEDVSCLLDTLASHHRDAIPLEVFISVSCPRGMGQFATTMEMDCKEYYKGANMDIMMQQANKCINLRKEDGYDSHCDKISCNGVLVMSSSELSEIPVDDVWGNLEDLALPDIPMAKAQVLLSKAKEKKKLEDMTQQDLGRLGSLYKAMSAEDVDMLPDFTEADSKDAVHAIGRLKDIPTETAKKLKEKILTEYKKPEALSSEDLVLLGNMLCDFTEEELNKVPLGNIRSSMRFLGAMDCGDMQMTTPLYNRAVVAYDDNGLARNKWDSATMAEMNLLLKAMKPEDVKDIPDTAFGAITPMAMASMSEETFKVIKLDQLRNLTRSAVRSITPEQRASMTPEMKAVVESINPAPSEPFGSRSDARPIGRARWVDVVVTLLASLVLVVVLV